MGRQMIEQTLFLLGRSRNPIMDLGESGIMTYLVSEILTCLPGPNEQLSQPSAKGAAPFIRLP